MKVLSSLAMAFLTFSRIPLPHVEWRPESMRYLMCFFPLVGTVIGLLVGLWCWLCTWLGFDSLMAALGITAIPLLVTGGIHMDGFCDTVDAQASHAPAERKREILKDPHSGAFALVGGTVFVLAYFVFAENLSLGDIGVATAVFVCLHMLSRCLSSIATLAFPLAGSNGMLASFHTSAESRRSLVACACLAVAVSAVLVALRPVAGAVMVVAALVCLLFVRVFSARQFGGMSGDLAGFFLQVCELSMLACLAIVTGLGL